MLSEQHSPAHPASATGISFREAARHAGKRADGICDRVTLGSRVLPHVLNLADPRSRRAFSTLTLVGMARRLRSTRHPPPCNLETSQHV